jgi:Na+/proline symporter
VYKQHLRPEASEAELVRVGRWFCLLLAAVTVLWLPVIELLSEQAPISLDPPRSP